MSHVKIEMRAPSVRTYNETFRMQDASFLFASIEHQNKWCTWQFEFDSFQWKFISQREHNFGCVLFLGGHGTAVLQVQLLLT